MFGIRIATLLTLAVLGAGVTAAADEPRARAIPIAATYGASQPRVALFLSGDGGWNLGVVSMAQAVARHGYIVAGIDFPKYLRERDANAPTCIPIAADLLATAAAVAHEHGVDATHPSLLIGYSSGATGVYGALAHAQAGDFLGGLSLGFAPDLYTSRPLCTDANLHAKPDAKLGYIYSPMKLLAAPWKALQGEIDQDVSAESTRAFVTQVGNAEITLLPKVGHGFSVERNWMPQFEAALAALGGTAAR